jgi:hypothetical protein
MKSYVSPTVDWLSITLFIGVFALVVGISLLVIVAWANAGSRNLALAVAALFASVFLLIVQLPFELRSKSETSVFGAEYTIDRFTPQIRQWSYPETVRWRLTSEVGASDALARSNPDAFRSDAQKLTQDMTIRSLVTYLFAEQFDWQIREVQVRGPSTGTWISKSPLSKPTECSMVTGTEIEAMLAKVGNLFTRGPIIRQEICLPPGSLLDVTDSSLSITTPFVRISFVVESTGGAIFGKPGTGGLDAPCLPDGSPGFETRPQSVRATTEYTWIRAQHRDIERYQRWAERVVTGAQQWFQG